MKNTTHNENAEAVRTGGFTLIELLVVIGIIGILAALVIVAINPSRQFAQARNAQRESNVATILNAIGQNIADNKGVFNKENGSDDCDDITNSTTTIAYDIGNVTDMTDLECLSPRYIPTTVPFDPKGGSLSDTKYEVSKDNAGRYTVCAPLHNEVDILDAGEYCLTR